MPLVSYDYDVVFNKKTWQTLSFQEGSSQQLEQFFQWYRAQTYKWPDKQLKHASQYVAKLWDTLDYVEKQCVTENLIFNPLPSEDILQNTLGFQAIATQFRLEKIMLERLELKARIGQKEIIRVIAVHPKYFADPEVRDAIFLQLKKHNPNHCIITTTLEGLQDALSIPTLRTIVPIGHGFTRTKDSTYTCGPIDGIHDTVAKTWSKLLQSAPQVEHLRLVSCYYGLANPAFDDKQHGDVQYNTKKYHRDTGRVTALVTYKPSEPLPFHPESLAAMIWQDLVVKGGRDNFCLSATPMILNPLPPYKPTFFAATDKDHYPGGEGIGKPMWQESKLRDIDKTKAISLATENSFKLNPPSHSSYKPY